MSNKAADPNVIVITGASSGIGNNAVHDGPDSRAIPGGQMPEEVAEVIAGVIESRAADVYTATGSSARVAAYYAGLGG